MRTFNVILTDGDGGTASTAEVNLTVAQPRSVTSVVVPVNATYKTGDTLSFTVNFSENITVDTTDGTPRLALNIGGTTKYADYVSGSGSQSLVFTYVLEVGLTDNGGISVSALENGGGTLQDATRNDATLALNGVGATTSILVDSTPPSITFSELALSADTGTSNTDFITVTAAQTITATLSAAVETGDIVYGSLDNGSNWTDITGKVVSTTLTWDGVTLTGSNTLKLKIADQAGNEGSVYSQNYVLDVTAPSFSPSLGTPADNATGVSISAPITVRFSEPLHTSSDLGLVYLKTVSGNTELPPKFRLPKVT